MKFLSIYFPLTFHRSHSDSRTRMELRTSNWLFRNSVCFVIAFRWQTELRPRGCYNTSWYIPDIFDEMIYVIVNQIQNLTKIQHQSIHLPYQSVILCNLRNSVRFAIAFAKCSGLSRNCVRIPPFAAFVIIILFMHCTLYTVHVQCTLYTVQCTYIRRLHTITHI